MTDSLELDLGFGRRKPVEPRIETSPHDELVYVHKGLEPVVIFGGQGLRTDGLMACIAIAGSFERAGQVAFMTHYGAQEMGQNMMATKKIADQFELRDQLGSLVIFRKDPSMVRRQSYRIGGQMYSYDQTVAALTRHLQAVFSRATVVEGRYGVGGRSGLGEAKIMPADHRFETDMECGWLF